MKKKTSSKIFQTAEEMDNYLEHTDLGPVFREKGVWKKPVLKKINLDLPEGSVAQIDQIAEQVGVSRQPLLKIWIHERLKVEKSSS